MNPDASIAEVVCISPKYQIDKYLGLLCPMGATIPELIGCRYVNRNGNSVHIGKSAVKNPIMYFSSDINTFFELVDSDFENFKPKYLIVDENTLSVQDINRLFFFFR